MNIRFGVLILIGMLFWNLSGVMAQACDPARPVTTAEELTNRGRECIQAMNIPQGVADLTRAIEIDPNYTPAYNERGIAYRYMGDPQAALDDLNQALALDPNYADAYYTRGMAHYDLGNYDRAHIDFQRALDLRYASPQYVYNMQGWTNFYQGRYDQAVEAFNRALSLDANLSSSYWGLGDTYRALEQFEQAVEYYHHYIDLTGPNAVPEVVAYVMGYEGQPMPGSSVIPILEVESGGGRSGLYFVVVLIMAFAGMYLRYRWTKNRWQAYQAARRKPKYQQVEEQTRDLAEQRAREQQSSRPARARPAVRLNMEHPANAGVLATLAGRTEAPASLPAPETWGINGVGGCHPDLVEFFWEKLPTRIPEYCRLLVYGRPALVHPQTGVVFGFCMGTHLTALRLPEPEYSQVATGKESLKWTWNRGNSLDAQRIGPDWVFVSYDGQWGLRAYENAGSL